MAATEDESGVNGRRSEPLDWSRILTEHAPWMRCVVLARVGEPQAVDEVLQEIAMAAVAQQSPLRDASKVGPWLYRLVVVHAVRYRRGQARRRNRLQTYRQRMGSACFAVEGDGGASDPLNLLLRSERRELTARALQRLPGRDAEVLMLKYGEHWSYQRIATQLGITVAAVESRLQRARERLRVELRNLDRE